MSNDAYRNQTSSGLLHILLPLQNLIGVSRLADATPMDRLRIPVVSAIRPDLRDAQITLCQGKGMSLRSAVTGALMEALERHCAALSRPALTASLSEIAAGHQCYAGEGETRRAWPQDMPAEWLRGEMLGSSDSILIPAGEVLFPYTPSPGVTNPFVPSTSGISAGSSRNEALFHAMLERIERHAVGLFRQTGTARLIEETSEFPEDVQCLLERFSGNGIEYILLDVSTCPNVVVVMMISIDPYTWGPSKLIGGQAAHCSPAKALSGAILECAQSRIVAIQAAREDLARHKDGWTERDNDLAWKFALIRHMASAQQGVTYPELSARCEAAPRLSDPLELADAIGLDDPRRVQFVDLQVPASLPLHVVSARIDGMPDLYVDKERRSSC